LTSSFPASNSISMRHYTAKPYNPQERWREVFAAFEKANPLPHPLWAQSAGSVELRSGVRTLPVPAQTGQVTRLPPTISTPGWPACR
jgi:hypothetical protein